MVLGAFKEKNVPIWIVAVYQPCFLEGPLSTYQQQLQHLDFQRPQCPRACFMANLLKEIWNWQLLGELLLVLGDFNDDMTQVSFQQ